MPNKTSGTRGAKRNKKTGKLRDLPAKAKRADAVRGGVISGNTADGVQISGSNENPMESVSFRR